MTRLLAAIVIIELLVCAWLIGARLRRPAPPEPDLAMVDAIAAEQLRERARHVKTAGDWRDLGEANMAVGYFPEAEACHRIAFDRDRGNANLAFEYAFALERLGRLDDAIREYRRAIDLGHERPADCHFLAGRCQMRGENEAAALAEFEAAGDLPTARYERARIWAHRGQPATSLQLVEPLLHEFPDTIQPAILRYQIAQHQQDRLAMFIYADRAERAKRRLPGPFDRESSRLMDAHARLGQHGRWQLASKLIPAGKYADAEAQLRAALAVGWHPIGADLLAEVALDLGRVDEAVRLLEEVVARDGPTAQGLRRLGDALAEAGRAGGSACRLAAIGICWRYRRKQGHASSIGGELRQGRRSDRATKALGAGKHGRGR